MPRDRNRTLPKERTDRIRARRIEIFSSLNNIPAVSLGLTSPRANARTTKDIFIIDDGEGDQVVFLDFAGCFFLIVFGLNKNDIGMH